MESEQRKDSLQVTKNEPHPVTATALDPDGKHGKWISEHLCADDGCGIDPADIGQGMDLAFQASDSSSTETSPSSRDIASFVARLFPTAILTEYKDSAPHPNIVGVRWAKLEGCLFSDAIPTLTPLPTLRAEAHPLLHLTLEERATAWLKICFRRDRRISMSVLSIRKLYVDVFSRSRDTHPLLPEVEFIDCVLKTFRGTENVAVSTEYSVIKGISVRFKRIPADKILAEKRQKDLARLGCTGLVEYPRVSGNVFNQKLLEDPLLSLPHNAKNFAISSPFIDRVRRRNGGGPLGDEEPGFPGVSMKKEQKNLKRELSKLTKTYPAIFKSEYHDAAINVMANKSNKK